MQALYIQFLTGRELRPMIAVEMPVTGPRKDPSVRNSWPGLLPRVFDGTAAVGLRVKDSGFWQLGAGGLHAPFPGHAVFLAPKNAAASGQFP